VVPASQLKNCAHCSAEAQHQVCSQCAMPQPVLAEEDYFSILEVPRKFGLDRENLEKRFYNISRMLHPDRFTTFGSAAQDLSLKRMSFLNQAYGTLKNPNSLRDYLLELEGIKIRKPSVPSDLAESWFELQELMLEDPVTAEKKLVEFENELKTLKLSIQQKLAELEKAYDQEAVTSILEKIAQEVQTESYLNSLERDMQRMKKNGYTN
jgi:molecular chaperone HscB